MSTHTPGPWRHNDNTGRLTGSSSRFVCSLQGQDLAHSMECRANARLITASPELLDALQRCVAVMEARCPEASPLPDARAAIAKATGG